MYWVIEGEGAAVHVLGTIHLGSPDLPDPPGEALAAFDSADRLVGELSSAEMASAAFAVVGLVARSMLPEGLSVGDYLSRHDAAALRRVFGKRWSSFERLEPWLVNFLLQAEIMARAGFDERYGLDRRLYARAGDREVAGLDTLAGQLALFDAGGAEDQAAALSVSLRGLLSGDSEEEAKLLLDAYKAGDADALALLFAGYRGGLEPGGPEEAEYERVFAVRNRLWAGKIASWLDEGGTWFVFAGAGHFLGEGSVFDELRALGALR